jgi:hypothetical protein
MFVRGVERSNRPPPGTDAAARCAGCGQALELETVLSAEVERRRHVVTGYVVFQHRCGCSPGAVRVSRSRCSHAAMVALFGAQPWLPYRAPFRYQPVADDDARLARWRWELDQVADVGELLLFLDDARARRRPGSTPASDA